MLASRSALTHSPRSIFAFGNGPLATFSNPCSRKQKSRPATIVTSQNSRHGARSTKIQPQTSGKRCLLVLCMFMSKTAFMSSNVKSLNRRSVCDGIEVAGAPAQLSEEAKARVQGELAGQTGETDSEVSGTEKLCILYHNKSTHISMSSISMVGYCTLQSYGAWNMFLHALLSTT